MSILLLLALLPLTFGTASLNTAVHHHHHQQGHHIIEHRAVVVDGISMELDISDEHTAVLHHPTDVQRSAVIERNWRWMHDHSHLNGKDIKNYRDEEDVNTSARQKDGSWAELDMLIELDDDDDDEDLSDLYAPNMGRSDDTSKSVESITHDTMKAYKGPSRKVETGSTTKADKGPSTKIDTSFTTKVERRVLMNVVQRNVLAVLTLLSHEDVIKNRPTYIIEHLLDIVDGVGKLQSDVTLDDLDVPLKVKQQVERRVLMDLVTRRGSFVLQLLSSEDQELLIKRNPLFFMDHVLDVVDGAGRLDLINNADSTEFEGTARVKQQVEHRVLMDVVVRKGSNVINKLASEQKTDPQYIMEDMLDVVVGRQRLDYTSLNSLLAV